jgi:Zn-dependent peptidase ImmA (M78 family)
MPTDHIEAASLCLLAEYGRKYGDVVAPPVPVEAVLEAHLGLGLDFDDLPGLVGVPDVLGATWIQDRRVLVDESLDPEENTAREGRYRFTVAHEVGHWELHRRFFLEDAAQPSLFGEKKAPSIVCRTSSQKEPMEWQADAFAGFLLMPKEMVLKAWEAHNGSLNPYIAAAEMADLSARWGLAEDDRPTVGIARTLAREIRVSGQAMQIRLIGLGLIKTEKPAPDLFTRARMA